MELCVKNPPEKIAKKILKKMSGIEGSINFRYYLPTFHNYWLASSPYFMLKIHTPVWSLEKKNGEIPSVSCKMDPYWL